MSPDHEPNGGRMRREWDAMAREDAIRYICDGTLRDEEEFFRTGEELVAQLLEHIGYSPDAGQTALEIGCGLGRTVRALSTRFGKAIGADISSEMVRQARELHASYPNIEFVAGNGVDLAFAQDGSIDFCFSYAALQHIPDRGVVAGYVREIARVLRPGGTACLQLHTHPPGLWAAMRDGLKRAVGSITAVLGLRRLYRDEPRYPCRWVYPIPFAEAERMVLGAGLEIEAVEAPDTPTTFFVCSKPPAAPAAPSPAC